MRLSIFLQDCDYLCPPRPESINGAFLSTQKFLRWVANEPAFEKLEVFLSPSAMTDHEAIATAAGHILDPHSRGKGRLSFYPMHSLAEVWSDGVPRIIRSLDPFFMARDRFFRDSFAAGPTALSVDTQLVAAQNMWQPLANLLTAPEVAYDSIQCISRTVREVTEETFRALGASHMPCRLDVIPKSVDTNHFRPPTIDERAESRRKLGVPEHAVVAIYSSRVGPHSKADIYPLIQALAKSSAPDDLLLFSGPPTSSTAYESILSWARGFGVEDRCRIHGPCESGEVVERLWAADFFVLPCDNPTEGLGIAVLEALACGLPALVSEWDGMREAVREGVNGMFIPTHWFPGSSRIGSFSPITPHQTECLLLSQCLVLDHDVLAKKLGMLFKDTELRARLSQGALDSAQSLSDTVYFERLLVTYKEQLGEAANEPESDRQRRRETANRLIHATDYERLMPTLATRKVQPTDRLELTESGRDFVTGRLEISMPEEVPMLASPELISMVLESLARGPMSIEDLVALQPLVSRSDMTYVLATIAKRGIARLIVV